MEKAIFRTLCTGFLLLTTFAFSQTGFNYSGVVTLPNDSPMSGVVVYLYSENGELVATDTSLAGGAFEFTEIAAGNYTVTFFTEAEAGGVALDDANLILEYLNEECEFTEIQALAADVSGNGVINMGDYQQIVNHYLNQGIPFPVGPWVYAVYGITIPSESRDGTMKLGSSSGDVNGSLQPDPKRNPIYLENTMISLTREANNPITFTLSPENNLEFTGMHLVFRVPENLRIISAESHLKDIIYFMHEGLLKVTCMDSTRQVFEIEHGMPVVTIKAEEINISDVAESYHLVLCDESHFIDIDGNLFSGLSLSLPTINLTSQKQFSHSAFPNPFLQTLTLEYQLPEEGMVNIALFDQYGRLISEIEDGFRTTGNHQVKYDGASLAPGIYHYSIKYSGQNQQIDNGTVIKSK
jgi:hypothetical protein